MKTAHSCVLLDVVHMSTDGVAFELHVLQHMLRGCMLANRLTDSCIAEGNSKTPTHQSGTEVYCGAVQELCLAKSLCFLDWVNMRAQQLTYACMILM